MDDDGFHRVRLSSTETSSLCLWKPRIPLHKYIDSEYVSVLNELYHIQVFSSGSSRKTGIKVNDGYRTTIYFDTMRYR